ncbi:Alpha/Beta hydrolase protein [Blastocladiella britannica]|nr:Alpha/Beta hydrolase protein [Blastocladiella britannica]
MIWRPSSSPTRHLVLALPGLLTNVRTSRKFDSIARIAKQANADFLTLDYYGCFSNHGDIWSGRCTHDPRTQSVTWSRWTTDIRDACVSVAATGHPSPTRVTVIGCSMGFALALDTLAALIPIWSTPRQQPPRIHLIGVGASPDPASAWARRLVLHSDENSDVSKAWGWLPSMYAEDPQRGYPIPLSLVQPAPQTQSTAPTTPAPPICHLSVTLIHGSDDAVIPLDRAQVELPAAIHRAFGQDQVTGIEWRVIPGGDHRLSSAADLQVLEEVVLME